MDLGGQDVLRIESQVDAQQQIRTLDEKPRAREQDQRKRHLTDHESGREAPPAGLHRRGRLVQGFAEIDRGSMQRRGDSEEDAREQRHGKRERQDRPVHAHLAHPWQDVLAQRRIERIRRPERDHQAESATDEGEQDALGEELAQQPRPACA